MHIHISKTLNKNKENNSTKPTKYYQCVHACRHPTEAASRGHIHTTDSPALISAQQLPIDASALAVILWWSCKLMCAVHCHIHTCASAANSTPLALTALTPQSWLVYNRASALNC